MKPTDWGVVAANLYGYKGKHWLDKEKKMRFMEFCGEVFKWNPKRERWERYEEEI